MGLDPDGGEAHDAQPRSPSPMGGAPAVAIRPTDVAYSRVVDSGRAPRVLMPAKADEGADPAAGRVDGRQLTPQRSQPLANRSKAGRSGDQRLPSGHRERRR